MIVRYGIISIESFRQMGKQALTYLFEDLGKRERKTYPELSFLIAMNHHLPPHIQCGAPRDIRFTELDIHRSLLVYSPLLDGLSSFFRPTQEMANFSSKELDQAPSKDPPFKPYLTRKLHASHWTPETAGRLAAQTQWGNYAK